MGEGRRRAVLDNTIDPEVNEVLFPKWLIGTTVALLALAAGAAGCGSGDSSSPTVLKVGVSESGKQTTFSAPASTEGGLVELKLTNEGKAPHGAQLVRYTGSHTAKEALEELESENEKTPDWLRAEGGIGGVAPGEVGTATVNLEAGNFLISDAAAFGEKPASTEIKVTEGDDGDLPSTPGEVVAEEAGHDKYAWDVSGLKAGRSQITFNSEGEKAIHLIIAAPIKGKAPPLSQIKKEFAAPNGPPPSYLDFENAQSTAVLDGGKSQTTEIDLKPGKYLFFCPLTDRDGGKPHDQEGLLSVETVK
jgi:hypothetical protein